MRTIGLIVSLICSLTAWSAERPNIVLIMADDMGYSDIGSYGGEIKTPNLDRLAKEGLRFSQFYNNAKCSPTRASLLTGLYSQQVGIHNGPAVMKNCVTLAEVLKSAGYRTLMAGKWHAAQLPVERGFDRYYGLTDGCCNFWNPGDQREGEAAPVHKTYPRKWAIDDQVISPFTPTDPNFYTTDAFTTNAIEFLDEYKEEENPFFLYLAYTAPHYPLHAWPEDIAKYKDVYKQGWDNIRKQRHHRQMGMGLINPEWGLAPRDEWTPAWEDVTDPDAWNLTSMTSGGKNEQTWDHVGNREEWANRMAIYAAMVDRMDQNIGRLIEQLNATGKLDNTLILFLSDNGGCAERVNLTPGIVTGAVDTYITIDPPWANAQNTPFRKYKRYNHEGGISTPLIAWWPGTIKGNTITHQPGHIIDVMATVLDISEAEYPTTYQGGDVIPHAGLSLRPIFDGKERAPHEYLFWQFGKAKAVRHGKWKLVRDGDTAWELYDLEADRTELSDVVGDHADLAGRLEAKWLEWAKTSGVKL
jgi:arylsulfatase